MIHKCFIAGATQNQITVVIPTFPVATKYIGFNLSMTSRKCRRNQLGKPSFMQNFCIKISRSSNSLQLACQEDKTTDRSQKRNVSEISIFLANLFGHQQFTMIKYYHKCHHHDDLSLQKVLSFNISTIEQTLISMCGIVIKILPYNHFSPPLSLHL